MPIFQDPEQPFLPTSSVKQTSRCACPMQDCSAEPMPNELDKTPESTVFGWKAQQSLGREVLPSNEARAVTSNRAELIERIKRGESPTWVPKQPLKEYYKNADEDPPSPPAGLEKSRNAPSLLPSVEIQNITQSSKDPRNERRSPPIEIQRPSSALHTGDFTQDATGPMGQPFHPPGFPRPYGNSGIALGTSPTTPWYTPSSSFHGFQSGSQPHVAGAPNNSWIRTPWRSRASSFNSRSSSYVLKAPTSPLVQQSNNADLDFSPADRSPSPERVSRRHTLPAHALRGMGPSLNGSSTSPFHDAGHGSMNRRDNGTPYQRHQTRRSLTSNWSLQVSTSPHSPGHLRSRRTSYSDSSPLQNASMVGSFEESILRGSMSTAPSKPLDFTAQIGVRGKGSCKPKGPPHVTIPFPAVFYSWGGSMGRSQSLGDDEPSPYVGHIDFQSLLPSPERQTGQEDCLRREVAAVHDSCSLAHLDDVENGTPVAGSRKNKKRRRSPPPTVTPPGGSYRIPQQGQLQIIIKNPNKTAVKLFLVPYDLTGMEPGMKTFIRQRCYSTELVYNGLVASKEGSSSLLGRLDETKKKPTLRYLIHLNICSPSKGRFYLYQHIRVVFANRVPDNKEQLQNEIQVPQPRFSPYRPVHDTPFGVTAGSGARVTDEKAYRRRSSGYDPYVHVGGVSFSFNTNTPTPPIPSIPFNAARSLKRGSQYDTGDDCRPRGVGVSKVMNLETALHVATSAQLHSPPAHQLSSMPLSSSHRSSSSGNSEGYGKLNKGDSGYGGVFFGNDGLAEGGEGLLARKLKGLGVRRADRMGTHDDEGDSHVSMEV